MLQILIKKFPLKYFKINGFMLLYSIYLVNMINVNLLY